MAINKKLIHFENFSDFNSKKLSANKENTKYTIGISDTEYDVEEGRSVDILYQSIVYIKDTQQQWTHGLIYRSYSIVNSVDELNPDAPQGSLASVTPKEHKTELVPVSKVFVADGAVSGLTIVIPEKVDPTDFNTTSVLGLNFSTNQSNRGGLEVGVFSNKKGIYGYDGNGMPSMLAEYDSDGNLQNVNQSLIDTLLGTVTTYRSISGSEILDKYFFRETNTWDNTKIYVKNHSDWEELKTDNGGSVYTFNYTGQSSITQEEWDAIQLANVIQLVIYGVYTPVCMDKNSDSVSFLITNDDFSSLYFEDISDFILITVSNDLQVGIDYLHKSALNVPIVNSINKNLSLSDTSEIRYNCRNLLPWLSMTFMISDSNGNCSSRDTVYIDTEDMKLHLFHSAANEAVRLLFTNGEAYYYVQGFNIPLIGNIAGGWYSQSISKWITLPKTPLKTARVGDFITFTRVDVPASDFYSKYVDFNSINLELGTVDRAAFNAYKSSLGLSSLSDGLFIKFLIVNGYIRTSSSNPKTSPSALLYPLAVDGMVTTYIAQITPNTENFYSGEFWPGNMTGPGIYSYITAGRPEGSEDGELYTGYVSPDGTQTLVSMKNPSNTFTRDSVNDTTWLRIGVGHNFYFYEEYDENNNPIGEKIQGTGEIFNDYTNNLAHPDHGHAEGQACIAAGWNSHAEGFQTVAGEYGVTGNAHSEGNSTWAAGNNSHAEGVNTIAEGHNSHAEGDSTIASNWNAHAEGYRTIASGNGAHAEGNSDGVADEAFWNVASGFASHTEGRGTQATNNASHAEGISTSSLGLGSHAEGIGTRAEGEGSHAEGYRTHASGMGSHAEGTISNSIGDYSHAEGCETLAEGTYSHAEGAGARAKADFSHAEGYYTVTNNIGEHAEGKFNYYEIDNLIHSVGIGDVGLVGRINAHAITSDGKHYIYGIGGYKGEGIENATDLATSLNNLITVRYSELVSLRDSNKLSPGKLYRITDYVTTTSLYNTQSSKHPFDIIVEALTTNTLSENAKVCLHEGDTYFENNNLEAWEIKYCLDNDNLRFYWAVDSGQTVIDSSDVNINTSLITENKFNEPFLPDYYIYIDITGNNFNRYIPEEDEKRDSDFFIEYRRETSPDGLENQLCIYKNDLNDENYIEGGAEEGVDYADKFFYYGTEEVDGIIYDKWKKSENESWIIGDHYIPSIEYILTKQITVGNISYMPSGKGVIYYMKDEYNNECPYDFKNIMFKIDSPNFLEDFYYTFSHITDDEVTDMSLTGKYLSNIIKESYEETALILNNNVFISTNEGYVLNFIMNGGLLDVIIELHDHTYYDRIYETRVAYNSSGEIKIYCEADLIL